MDENAQVHVVVQPGFLENLPLRQLSLNSQDNSSSDYGSFEVASPVVTADLDKDLIMDSLMELEKDLPANELVKEDLDLECPQPLTAPASLSGFLGGLQPIEDFDKEMSEKPKFIVFGGSSIGLPAVTFQNMCQTLDIMPKFEVQLVGEACFSGQISIGDQVVKLEETFKSKKKTREALCVRGLSMLESQSPQESRKRKRCEVEANDSAILDFTAPSCSTADLESENWIGLLNNWTQQKGIARPEYVEHSPFMATGIPRFSYTCRITSGPLTPFGSDDGYYRSKHAAKKATAREAVLWLREQGDKMIPGPKRQKHHHSLDPDADLGHTGLTQNISSTDLNATLPLTDPQRLHGLVAELKLFQPAWRFEPSLPTPEGSVSINNDSGFWNVFAQFVPKDFEKEPKLAGEVGRVSHVFGRKNAKTACAREVLRVLEEIKQQRNNQ